MPSQAKSRLRSSLPIVAGALVASVAYYYATGPVSQWWKDRWHVGTISGSDDFNDESASANAAKINSKPKQQVIVVFKKELLREHLLTSNTKEAVELIIIYPEYHPATLKQKAGLFASLQTDYVSNPTKVIKLTEPEALKPLLRHLVVDSIVPTVVVGLNADVDGLKDDSEIAKYVGEVIVLNEDDDDANELIWKQRIT
ncbi:hypothetical protein V1514DRAFT_353890 [Lipomyces japonicus]|uniref:uncharacterized protein n=1 Tax=Lipomyces japonicus TaxID=56871 RepID=UPI0034CF4385